MSSEQVSSQQSYRQIARATTILGGSSTITIALRILKTKVLAILLGPSGIGLLGIYTLLMDVVGVVATEDYAPNKRKLIYILEEVNKCHHKDMKVLDVGCGSG